MPMQAITPVWPKLPRTWPTRLNPKSTITFDRPPLVMREPARMKYGRASRLKESMIAKAFWANRAGTS